jgi:hypothetical protein
MIEFMGALLLAGAIVVLILCAMALVAELMALL